MAVLLVASCAHQFTKVEKAGYRPKWQVGDWWVTKTQVPSGTGHGWWWQLNRFDVLSRVKLGGLDCFVLQHTWDTASTCDGTRFLYYVRTDNYSIVREDQYSQQAGKLGSPTTFDFPEGMFGDLAFGQRLPQFPFDVAAPQDSTFCRRGSGLGMANVRQFVGAADSPLLDSYLSGPEPTAGATVKLCGGKLFSVLAEWGAPQAPGSGDVPYTYALQLWSTDYPWRLYSEWGEYWPRGSSARRASNRSWLIGSGHKKQ